MTIARAATGNAAVGGRTKSRAAPAGAGATGDQEPVRIRLAGDPAADHLLSTDPLALVIGMVLDQQVPLERAFSAPWALTQRLGRPLDAEWLAEMDPDLLAAIFSQPPALHRFPVANAARVQQLCRLVTDRYQGQAAKIWQEASSGAELLSRVKALPGFGDRKARIFVALLAKQMGIRPPGWAEASAPFGEPGIYCSVADITNEESLARVRAYKRELKAATRTTTPQTTTPQTTTPRTTTPRTTTPRTTTKSIRQPGPAGGPVR